MKNFSSNFRLKTIILINYVALQSGESPIHLACRFDHIDTIIQLCKFAGNVNLVDEHGESTLHVASFFGFPKIVHVLCEVGANPNLQDEDGNTCLHVAGV